MYSLRFLMAIAVLWSAAAGGLCAAGPLTIDPTLPDAFEGSGYFHNLSADGGVAPYTWSLAVGSNPLPNDLTLSPHGQIGGNVMVPPGTYTFTVRVSDSGPHQGLPVSIVTREMSLTVIDFGVPLLYDMTPSQATAGGPAITLTIDGAHFSASSVVRWNGSDLNTTFISPNRLTASVPAALVATGVVAEVLVFDPVRGASAASLFTVINPSVSISSLTPYRAIAGTSFTLTVHGSGFVPASQVRWSGTGLSTSFVSSTQLTATVSASLVATPGVTATVTVVNPAPTGSSAGSPFLIDYPVPSLTSISPTTRLAGQGSFVLTVRGTNFFPASIVRWDNWYLPTTYVGPTELRANVTADLTADGAVVNILVFNPDPYDQVSQVIPFTVTNPGLTISSLEPPEAIAGSPAFVLTVRGTGFSAASQVVFDQYSIPTTFIDSTQLTAAMDSGLVFTAGTKQLRVLNPQPVGGSQLVDFVIKNPQPVVSSMSPTTGQAGRNAQVTLTGTGLNSSSQVLWDGTAIFASAVHYVYPATLVVEISSNYTTEPGLATVQVFNPGPGGGASNTMTFTIAVPNVQIDSLTPPTARAGDPTFTMTVRGHGFYPTSEVRWNGSLLPTSFVSPQELAATVDASLIVNPGGAAVKIFNPVEHNGSSSAVEFVITSDGVGISILQPASKPAGGPGFTLIIRGATFVPASKVYWNGTEVVSGYSSPTQMSAAIARDLIASPGTAQVTVVNPAADGGTSNALIFTIEGSGGLTISSLTPKQIAAGGPSFTLAVQGDGFVSGSTIFWSGTALQTSFVSTTQVTASVDASLIQTAGPVDVVVRNLGSQSGTSNTIVFTITDPNPSAGPSISSLSPSQATAGGSAFVLTIHGNGFAAGAQAQWKGAAISTNFVNASQLTANIADALIANPGTASVTVSNPAPGGGLSNALAFTIAEQQAPLQWQISLLGGPAPAKQHPVQVSLSQPSVDLVTGRLGLAFTADPMLPPGLDDPAIEFSRGGRTAAFVIPAGGVNADFGGAAPLLQTGTVAGEITLTVSSLRSSGADITPSPAPAASFVIGRQAPTIDSVRIVNLAPASFGIEVVGFATAREITSANFQFAAKPGQTLPAIPTTAALGAIAQNWYQDPASVDFGSQFVYTRTFAIEGATSAIASVAVTLSNSVGNSNTVSATF